MTTNTTTTNPEHTAWKHAVSTHGTLLGFDEWTKLQAEVAANNEPFQKLQRRVYTEVLPRLDIHSDKINAMTAQLDRVEDRLARMVKDCDTQNMFVDKLSQDVLKLELKAKTKNKKGKS